MKISKRLVILLTCILLVGVASLALCSGRKPFRDLKPSDIVSAAVRLVPPDETIPIVEIKELTSYLNDVVIYNKDNSYADYSGQGVIFSLKLADGTQKEIMAYNPFLVIDGVGYKTKYEPCEVLSSYANRLLRNKNK